MPSPRYSYPMRLAPGFLGDLLLARQRSFRQDGIACIQRLRPALHVEGAENIPSSGPCVLTVNHYHRPGFGAWWIALAIASQVPQEMHWVMTAELTFPGKWYACPGRPFSRWLLRRLAGMYGFASMPPMPPREQDVAARAHTVRAVLEYIQGHPQGMLAMSPEGSDPPGGILAWPPPGAGRFLLKMAASGFSFLPVGFWEAGGEFCLRFGTRFRLQIPPGLKSDERDHAAAKAVMEAIACQMPKQLRGEFK